MVLHLMTQLMIGLWWQIAQLKRMVAQTASYVVLSQNTNQAARTRHTTAEDGTRSRHLVGQQAQGTRFHSMANDPISSDCTTFTRLKINKSTIGKRPNMS